MTTDRSKWIPLSPVLESAINEFNEWSMRSLSETETAEKIEYPLYHYTDAVGLDGIIKNQQMWFTHYLHLNDPTEFLYGMKVASFLLEEIGKTYRTSTRIFCEMVNMLSAQNAIRNELSFFLSSFSREPDDLGQWRAYGNNGCGFSLGLAPHLFHVVSKTDSKPHKNVLVTPVVYGDDEAQRRHRPAIEKAASIVDRIVNSVVGMNDENIGMPFFDEMARALLASPMIWNSLTIKHAAYKNEKEVRLAIVGDNQSLLPYVSTRARAGDIVPYIKSDMPIQEHGSVIEIVVGPSAADSAEDGIRFLLQPFIGNPTAFIRRSNIPYRLSAIGLYSLPWKGSDLI